MANNRLYIYDDETGERILLAKSFGNGWALWGNFQKEFNKWAESRDVNASYGNCELQKTAFFIAAEGDRENV